MYLNQKININFLVSYPSRTSKLILKVLLLAKSPMCNVIIKYSFFWLKLNIFRYPLRSLEIPIQWFYLSSSSCEVLKIFP